MKKLYLFLIILLFSITPAAAQKPKSTPRKPTAVKPKTTAANEKDDFEKAVAQTDLMQKIAALQKFTADFPKSAELIHARELIVTTRAQLADEKLRGGDTAAGIELFKQAVTDAPNPMSDKLFSEIILQFPTNLFYSGQQTAAVEIAKAIEEKISGNAKQLLGLATFYIGTENGSEAQRLANKAIEIDPQMPAAYQTLGLASRLNFQLDESVAAYTKAAELDPNSIISKRSLAEMKRAIGKSDDAVALYREILGKNPDDAAAQTGLTLSLFDSEKQPEAESEMSKSLEKAPNNLTLLVGAAYWYTAHNASAKATDLAQKAIALEPRYTWAHIAMARALVLQNRYTEAEKELLLARQYGNFPTLTYELAAVRLAAGFYQEAAQELKKGFTVTDGAVQTNLGNRVSKNGKNFIEVLAPERSASIFEPLAADSPEAADKLKALLALSQKLDAADATDDDINQAVDEFVKGDDKSKTHRQLYAAQTLLQAKRDLPKALELTQAAISGVDSALQVPNPAGAVMADELYESRTIAISRGEVVVVPTLAQQTLSAILRGRIEETAGWTLFNQGKPEEAVVRLKRAVSVLPEKSAWWRSSMWRLGTAFDASNKPALALDAYTKSYVNSPPDVVKYAVIERVYQQVNGNLDGLEKKIGAKPGETVAANAASETPQAIIAPTPRPIVERIPETISRVAVQATPKPTPTPEASPITAPETIVKPTPETAAEASPTPLVSLTPALTPIPEPSPTPTPAILTPETSLPPKIDTNTDPSPTPKIEAPPESTLTPKTDPTPQTSPTPQPEMMPEASATPRVDSAPILTSETKAEDKTSDPTPTASPSSLFAPIIIKIPKTEPTKTVKTDSETAQTTTPDSPTIEKSKDPASDDNSGAVRPRISKAPDSTPDSDCQITVNQQNITLSANTGKLGILVSLPENGDISKIIATSSNPSDIDVSLDPDIGKQSNSAFFIIKSISPKGGIYTVTFDSPCGKKEVQVRVR